MIGAVGPSESKLDFRILGRLQVLLEGSPMDVGQPMQKNLLGLLVIEARRPLSGDVLVDRLWPDDPPKGGVRTLRFHISRLRESFARAGLDESPIVTTNAGYVLDVADEQIDARRFEALVSGAVLALDDDPSSASKTLGEALGLWSGPPLADFTYAPFASAEIARLEEARLAAVETRIDADLACGRERELIGDLNSLASEHPHRERLHGQLMVALYRSGRQAEALSVCSVLRASLRDELGLDPAVEIQDLEQRILDHDPTLAPGPAGSLLVGDPGGAQNVQMTTLTFLFTDVESSTRLWEETPEGMQVALEGHDALVRATIAEHGGWVFSTGGDSFATAFAIVADAVEASVDLQRSLTQEPWPDGAQIRVRMGLHTGDAHARDGDYFGIAVNRAARIMGLASGGQVLVSEATAGLLADHKTDNWTISSVGRAGLSGQGRPERVSQIHAEGLDDSPVVLERGSIVHGVPQRGVVSSVATRSWRRSPYC